jgi:hypothetical protein
MLQNSCIFCNILGHFGTPSPRAFAQSLYPSECALVALGVSGMSREWRRKFKGRIPGVIRRSVGTILRKGLWRCLMRKDNKSLSLQALTEGPQNELVSC